VTKTLVEQYVEESQENMRLFQQERAVLEVTMLIERVMAEQGVTRSQLAAKLGRSKGWITQLLDQDRNKTIRTVADVLAVLGREFASSQRPIQIGRDEQASTHKINIERARNREQRKADLAPAVKKRRKSAS